MKTRKPARTKAGRLFGCSDPEVEKAPGGEYGQDVVAAGPVDGLSFLAVRMTFLPQVANVSK